MVERTPGAWQLIREDGFASAEIVAPDDVHIVCFGHDYDDYGHFGARHPRGATGRALTSARAFREYVDEAVANAEFIARSANAHDELVKALREAKRWVPSWVNDVHAHIDAALTLATEPVASPPDAT